MHPGRPALYRTDLLTRETCFSVAAANEEVFKLDVLGTGLELPNTLSIVDALRLFIGTEFRSILRPVHA